ncbi:hypothetical protein PtrM4_087370 [Pyrenophora tritici-repentis]|uniref:Maltose/galactoside acetyltransferase domain-containing protein n=1 Tax=Pyrenophora tritici-repentis TaxID=45151 RepID=A0A834VTQ4_9PLEO|nr:hypothetical protein PtrM4_087370 [Pyrenophora tritici-repentis]
MRLVHGLVAAYPRFSGCNKLYTSCREPTRSNSQRVEGARVQSKPDGKKEREASAPNTLCNSGDEPQRVSHLKHAAPFPAQDFRPSVTNYDRAHWHDRYLAQPQGCSLPTSYPRTVANDRYQTSQQLCQPKTAPLTSAGPAPQQARCIPARALKTEKEKMLDGESFFQYDEQLVAERAQCTGAIYNFNSTANPSVVVTWGD